MSAGERRRMPKQAARGQHERAAAYAGSAEAPATAGYWGAGAGRGRCAPRASSSSYLRILEPVEGDEAEGAAAEGVFALGEVDICRVQ